jgi:hypothetical protein
MAENQRFAEPLPIGLNNWSAPVGLLVGGSIADFRAYGREAGMGHGFDWTMVIRSRLYAEIGARAALHGFNNFDEYGVPLFGGLQQSFAPPLYRVNTWQRGAERLLMPSARGSLRPMRRLQRWVVGDGQLPGRLYVEELQPGEKYDNKSAPFDRTQTISPDLAYKLGTGSVDMLVAKARHLGIRRFGFSTDSGRSAQESSSVRVDPWHEWFPRLLAARDIESIRVSFARRDLKPQDDSALVATFDQAREILSGHPREDEGHMGELPEMLATARSVMAEQPRNQWPRVILHAQDVQLAGIAPRMRSAKRVRVLGEYVADRLGLL